MSAPPVRHAASRPSRLLLSWLLFCTAIAIHVADEAVSGFLAVYNPTVMALRNRLPWLPVPAFTFRVWITGLALGIALLFALSPFVARGVRWIRPLAVVLSIVMIANGLQHIVGTILGRTVGSVEFPRPMPGFYSSPVLIGASIYLLVQLARNRRQKPPR